jgi:hypothetical protein
MTVILITAKTNGKIVEVATDFDMANKMLTYQKKVWGLDCETQMVDLAEIGPMLEAKKEQAKILRDEITALECIDSETGAFV